MAPRRRSQQSKPPIPPTTAAAAAADNTPASAPPARRSRTYESSGPAPQQLYFPPRRRVVRTYGRRSLPAMGTTTTAAGSVSASSSAEKKTRALRQATLTQIDYVVSSSASASASGDGAADLLEGDGGDGDGDGEGEVVVAAGGRRRGKGKGKGRVGKRTRTVGDVPPPPSAALGNKESGFHTQTLTQLLGSSNASGAGTDDDGGLRLDEEEEEECGKRAATDLPLPGGTPPAKRRLRDRAGKAADLDPRTPAHKRIKVSRDEVPSSQPTPATLMLERYGPMPSRSPLSDRSTNVDAPPPTAETVSKFPRNLVIQDSYSIGSSQAFTSSPSVPAVTPRKETTSSARPGRQPLAEIPVASLELGGNSASGGDDMTPTTRRIVGAKRAFVEIPDSDDELGSIGSTPFRVRSTHQTPSKGNGAGEDFDIASDPSSSSRPRNADVSGSPAAASDSGASLGRSDKENDEPAKPFADDGESTASEDEGEGPGTPTARLRKAGSQTLRAASQRRGKRPSQLRERLTGDLGGVEAKGKATQLAASEESTAVEEEARSTLARGPRKLTGKRVSNEKPREAAPQIGDAEESTASESEEQIEPTPIVRKAASQKPPGRGDSAGKMRKSTPEIPSEESTSEAHGTPTPVVRRVQTELPPPSSSEEVYEETPRKPREKSSPILQRHTQGRSQYYSQGLESQRVPLDVISSLGPQTDRSDILISIHPEVVDEIVKGTRDHEFRSYKFPAQVSRCWIYTTRPVGDVKYMATLGPVKEPGGIDGNSGLGNAEFNAGTSGYKYAHKLLQVYQLNNPVPQADMPDHGLGNGPPHKYKYLPPAIVGQLMANLRCALFADGDEEWEADEGGVTTSQELEEQLRSDILHSTQMLLSEGRHLDAEEDVIPASQGPVTRSGTAAAATTTTTTTTRRTEGTSARLPVPARSSQRIRDRNQQQQQQQRSQQTAQQPGPHRKTSTFVRPSQATTASDASSPVAARLSQDKSSAALASVPRPLPELVDLGDDDDDDEEEGGSSDVGLSAVRLLPLPSSSQAALLPPDSLLVDEVRMAPPPVVWDSEDSGGEEEEEDGA